MMSNENVLGVEVPEEDDDVVGGVVTDEPGTIDNNTSVTVPSGTALGISGVPLYSGAMSGFDDWMSENGYDPTKDYNDARAELEFDYETSMATYGRKAEELAQMGLTASGVSDIYQLGAFNSYLQAQNDLANKKITAMKQYRQEYNKLLKENQANFNTDKTNAYNVGLAMYNGQNIEEVRTNLTNQGYDASIIENVVSSLSALDPNTLPTVQQFNSDVNAAYALGYEIYNGKNADEVYNKITAAGYSAEVAQAAKDKLTAIPESDWGNLPAVKGFQNTVDQAYAFGYELYNGENADEVYNKMIAKGYSAEVAQAAKDKLTAIPESDWGNLPAVKGFQNTVDQAYAFGYELYNGKNADEVYNKMIAKGFTAEVAQAAKDRLAAIPESDWGNLPAVKGFQDTVDQAYAFGYELYHAVKKADGTVENNADEVYNKMIAEGFSAEVAQAAKDRLAAIPESDWGNLPAVKADKEESEAQDKYDITNAVALWGSSYSQEDEEKIRNYYSDWSKEKVDLLIDRLNAFAGLTAPSKEEIISDGAAKLEALYDGSELSKENLRLLMKNPEYKDYAPHIEEIIGELDTRMRSRFESSLNDFSNLGLVDLSQTTFVNAIETARKIYGEGTDEYKAALDKITQKANESITAALETEDGFRNAYTLTGKSKEEWMAMDDSDKMIEILYAVGRYFEYGIISKSQKQEYFESWFESELSNLPADDSSLSVLDEIQTQVNEFKNEGVIDDSLATHFSNQLRGAKQTVRNGLDKETTKYLATFNGTINNVWDLIKFLGEVAQKTVAGS